LYGDLSLVYSIYLVVMTEMFIVAHNTRLW